LTSDSIRCGVARSSGHKPCAHDSWIDVTVLKVAGESINYFVLELERFIETH
jgi:hypothetical protein